MYLMGTYPTPDGDRDVLLIRLPSNNDEPALVDVPTGPGPLKYEEIHIVTRDITSLAAAGDLADDHLARSAELGEPARGENYLSDAACIASMQRALREAA
jgi:hypothetical protein